jgi:thiamine biosynthesis lipoprotein
MQRDGGHWRGDFEAMASPCQLLTEIDREADATELLAVVAAEAWRIEKKFSRYATDNIVAEINAGDERTIEVDEETAKLLDFADSLFRMSDGFFDITAGVLRKIWSFDGGSHVPAQSDIDEVLPNVGWEQVRWERPNITLQRGMQVDLGGIGKEYAVDRAAELIRQQTDASALINFGGDLVAIGESSADGWRVGIESVDSQISQPDRLIRMTSGALATSGDARRFVLKHGIRYSHVLNPMTGWPVEAAPRSITVAADTCTQAGMLATLAMLRGNEAEEFLDQQSIKYWCLR